MAAEQDRDTRVDFARWFVEHDDVEEAAAVLEPGDELILGRSDYRALEAALARRGLCARYQDRRVSVLAREAGSSDEPLAAGPRKPPARVATAAKPAAKKSA